MKPQESIPKKLNLVKDNKYNIIYIDPPWKFKTYSPKGKEKKSAENHYPTMTIEEIYQLDLKRIAKPDCVLFTWVTFPLLKEGLMAIEKWGFEYKTNAFTWVKRNKIADSWFWGTGYWTRANAELCLLATIGNPKRVSRSVHQVLDDRVMRHSKKPQTARDRIVQLCGDLPRIEIFAREQDVGWDATGYDLDGLDVRETIGFKNVD